MAGLVNQQAIAKKLNVSIGTVSKALRDSPDISEATRAKIVKTAADLGYAVRRKRATRPEHHFLGVMFRSYQPGSLGMPHTFFTGMSEIASELNVSLVAQEVLRSQDEKDVLDPSKQSPAMRNESLSGIVIVGEWSAKVMNELKQYGPCVSLPFTIPGVDIDQIGLDHVNSITELAVHLHGLGHRKIGFFGRCSALTWSTERFAGYANAISQLGLGYDDARVIDIEQEMLLEVGHQQEWESLVTRVAGLVSEGVTAWICSSDWPGNQLHRGLVRHGLNVPTDVSITGFDNTEEETLGMPPLTSTHLPRVEMGRAAVKRMMYRMREPDAATRRILFPCPMVDHGTTAPCRLIESAM